MFLFFFAGVCKQRAKYAILWGVFPISNYEVVFFLVVLRLKKKTGRVGGKGVINCNKTFLTKNASKRQSQNFVNCKKFKFIPNEPN